MKNAKLMSIIFVLAIVSTLGILNAQTLIAGKIYNADFTDTISGASVTVDCVHNGVTNTKSTTSVGDGSYSVVYSENNPNACDDGDQLTVSATKDGLYGSESGIINSNVFDTWDLAIVNVPLIPEFGVVVGVLTIVSALGVFFVVRRN